MFAFARVVAGRVDDTDRSYNVGYFEGLSLGALLRTRSEFQSEIGATWEIGDRHSDGFRRGLREAQDIIKPSH